MVRVIRPITASTNVDKDYSFTPSEVLDLLQQIDELKGSNISLEELSKGNLQYVIGNSVYKVTDTSNLL